jgi:hypothetical protein
MTVSGSVQAGANMASAGKVSGRSIFFSFRIEKFNVLFGKDLQNNCYFGSHIGIKFAMSFWQAV